MIAGLPYIIRSKNLDYDGKWKDAELSWDGWNHVNYVDKYGHPWASVEFDDPCPWLLVETGTGSHGYTKYRVKAQQPGKWLNAELSWDGSWGSDAFDHPMASVEFHDPTDWEFVPASEPNQYVISSQLDGKWMNAELAWDHRSDSHPMASVEFHDRTYWEVIPSYTVKGYWVFFQDVGGNDGGSTTIELSWGTQHTTSWSKEKSFSETVSKSVEAGFEIEGGPNAKASVTKEFSRSMSNTLGEEASTSEGTKISKTFKASEKVGVVWQFCVATTNNHHKYKNEIVVTKTRQMEATPNAELPPKCMPGMCKHNTGCQECQTACSSLDSDC